MNQKTENQTYSLKTKNNGIITSITGTSDTDEMMKLTESVYRVQRIVHRVQFLTLLTFYF